MRYNYSKNSGFLDGLFAGLAAPALLLMALFERPAPPRSVAEAMTQDREAIFRDWRRVSDDLRRVIERGK